MKLLIKLDSLIAMISISMLDSQTWIPMMVAFVSMVILLACVPYINRWAGDFDDMDR
ncbi:MAG: hypothetical protein HUJ53_05560 [Holdemanella sp.]|nr:hypothetical protein [Holdemanella sp.]